MVVGKGNVIILTGCYLSILNEGKLPEKAIIEQT